MLCLPSSAADGRRRGGTCDQTHGTGGVTHMLHLVGVKLHPLMVMIPAHHLSEGRCLIGWTGGPPLAAAGSSFSGSPSSSPACPPPAGASGFSNTAPPPARPPVLQRPPSLLTLLKHRLKTQRKRCAFIFSVLQPVSRMKRFVFTHLWLRSRTPTL